MGTKFEFIVDDDGVGVHVDGEYLFEISVKCHKELVKANVEAEILNALGYCYYMGGKEALEQARRRLHENLPDLF